VELLIELEDALLTALREIPGVKTADIQTGDLTTADVENLAWRFPCIYLSVGALTFTDANRLRECGVTVLALVGDKNARGDAAAKRGDQQSLGAYRLIQAVYDKFDEFRFRDGMKPLRIKLIDPVLHDRDKGLCLWRMEFEGKIVLNK